MGNNRTADTSQAASDKEPWAQTARQSKGSGRYPVCTQNRNSLGRLATRNGVWVRDDLLAAIERLGTGWRLAKVARSLADQAPGSRANRLVTFSRRQRFGAGGFGGEKTGPNPTDRAKAGTKHHIITDAQGLPLATTLTAANAHDSTQLLTLVDAIPPIRGIRGRPRRRPDQLYADRGYDSDPHRQALRQRSIQPLIARRYTEHGSGLGIYRWVVERTLSWLHQFRRLRVRFERYAHIHQAFLSIGCSLICLRFLKHSFC